jgi:hypothetical protein
VIPSRRLDEPDIVIIGVDAETLQAVYINVLNVPGGGFHDDLELVVMLQTVGVFPVAPVRRPPGRLDVRGVPGFRPEAAKERGGMELARPDLHIVGLLDDAAPVSPEFLKCEYEILKVHAGKIHVFYTTKESDLPMIFKSQAKEPSQVSGCKSQVQRPKAVAGRRSQVAKERR